jgi:hypothetical protein
MKWFNYTGSLISDQKSLDILTIARRRRVFSTENPKLISLCQQLQKEGFLKGGPDKSSVTANYRLTALGHKILKESNS